MTTARLWWRDYQDAWRWEPERSNVSVQADEAAPPRPVLYDAGGRPLARPRTIGFAPGRER